MTEKQLEKIINEIKNTNKTYAQIARDVGVTSMAILYWVRRLKRIGNTIPERKRGRPVKYELK